MEKLDMGALHGLGYLHRTAIIFLVVSLQGLCSRPEARRM